MGTMRAHHTALFLFFIALAGGTSAHAETVTFYTQPDDSGEILSQQATFQNTWIASNLGNLILGKESLSVTFTIKDPNANNVHNQPGGVSIGTCATCQNLQTYYFTTADRTLLSDGAFHTFTVQTGTTTLGLADGETPIFITFFNLSQYHLSTHIKSNVAGTIPYLIIEGTPPPPPIIPQAPPGVVTVYTQDDKTGVMTNPQATFQDAHIDSADLGNLNLGQEKLYITFIMKDQNASNMYGTPTGVCMKPADTVGCGLEMQRYYFTNEDRTLLADGASHTFMVETGTTTSAYADGTRPVSIGFFGLSQYQYGTKIKSNATQTIPFLTIQKFPLPDPCATPGACASNVLFLPGIEASRLYRPDYAGGTDQLWEPNIDSDVRDLYLNPDGASARFDVYTKDVIDEKNVLPIGQGNIYKSFIAQMNELKTAGTIVDWKAVPYDWRLSLDDVLNYGNDVQGRIYYSGDLRATSTPYVIQELRRLAKTSKTGKVTIVAHSNGGLVTKALTDKLGSEASTLIDKIIFVAVPQAGTPQAIGAILHGYDQGLPFDFFPLVLTLETAHTLAENMPSAYNLLPSANYFTYVDNPVVTFDDSDFLAEFRARYGSMIHDGAQLKNFITDPWRTASSSPSDLTYPSVGNITLLSRAETLHATLDAWTPQQGVSLYEVAGWGEDTLATIEYKEGKKSYCSNPQDVRTCASVPAIIYNPREVIEGDGTVLVPSALWTPAASTTKKYWVNLRDYNNDFPRSLLRLDQKHADILEVPEPRTLIQNIITNATSTIPLAFISTSTPPTDSIERLRFVLHSPLNLSATDNLGNVISSATSTIPGSRWRRYGEVQVLTVPKNTPLTLNLDGYTTGSFTLDMQEIDGDNIVTASSTFSAIPSATSTTATMAFTDGTIQNASPLLLDYDGNGATDFLLQSEIGEAVVFDITPPEATLTFDPISQKIKIVGTDNLSTTTISITATSSVITDEASNTLQIVFKKLKQEKKEIKLELQTLIYNGISTSTIPKTTLQYEWSTDKTGRLKGFEEKATIGSLTIEGYYDAKKNETRIKEKMKGVKERKKILPGLVVVGLTTNKGKIDIGY